MLVRLKMRFCVVNCSLSRFALTKCINLFSTVMSPCFSSVCMALLTAGGDILSILPNSRIEYCLVGVLKNTSSIFIGVSVYFIVLFYSVKC